MEFLAFMWNMFVLVGAGSAVFYGLGWGLIPSLLIGVLALDLVGA